jgi:D-glycero-alpha-D-manno-heptose-7-phosphate kinase
LKISVTVPCRIDLAGGTLDVYPLYLFENGGLTVNAAIDVLGRVVVEERHDKEIHIHSLDDGYAEAFSDLDEMETRMGGELDLAKKALRFYCRRADGSAWPQRGMNISLFAEAPRGSGLGTSSALLMALSCALNELGQLGLNRERIIDLGANIEAQVINIPTGKQDYVPPMFGGICSTWFGVDGHATERLDTGNNLVESLNQRLVLSFTNITRFSGITNWAMLKRYVEGEGDTPTHMQRIKGVAVAMRQSLLDHDLDEFARLLSVEWENRKALAEGVSTPEIDDMMAAASAAGARASKLCGAGGGGCMITYAEPEHIARVAAALQDARATLMPFQILKSGLRMEVSS